MSSHSEIQMVRLGDHVTKVGSGLTPAGGQAAYLSEGVPLIRSQNVRMNGFDPSGLAFISAAQDADMSGSRVQRGDVLLNITGASIGRVCVVPDHVTPANVNQHVCIIRGDGTWYPLYLSYFLSTADFQRSILEDQAGTTRQALTKAQIEAFRVPLPPLADQRRIAARLTEQLAIVDRARAAAQARLAAAEALPAAYLREVFEGLAADCQRRRLADLADIASGVTLGRRVHADTGREVPYLRVANVQEGSLRLDSVYTIRATEEEIAELRLRRGDLVMTEGGDADKLGRGTWWNDELPECIHQNHIFRVRFRPDTVDHEFFGLQLRSAYTKEYFLAHAKQTTGIATINRRILGDLPVLLPPAAEQHRIAADLSTKLTVADSLAAACRAELAAVDALPAALLRQAFAGVD